jgi:hypothetical protein
MPSRKLPGGPLTISACSERNELSGSNIGYDRRFNHDTNDRWRRLEDSPSNDPRVVHAQIY